MPTSIGVINQITKKKLTDVRVVQRHVNGVKDVDFSVGIGGARNSLGFLLHCDVFLDSSWLLLLVTSLLLATTLNWSLSSFCHSGSAWPSFGCKLGVGRIVGRNVLVKLLASLMDVVHFVVSGTAGATNTDKVLFVYLVSDLRKLALFATNILRDELVEMALQISQSVLTLDN